MFGNVFQSLFGNSTAKKGPQPQWARENLPFNVLDRLESGLAAAARLADFDNTDVETRALAILSAGKAAKPGARPAIAKT